MTLSSHGVPGLPCCITLEEGVTQTHVLPAFLDSKVLGVDQALGREYLLKKGSRLSNKQLHFQTPRGQRG